MNKDLSQVQIKDKESNIVSGELDITRKKLPNKASEIFNKRKSKLSDGTKSSIAGNESFFEMEPVYLNKKLLNV